VHPAASIFPTLASHSNGFPPVTPLAGLKTSASVELFEQKLSPFQPDTDTLSVMPPTNE
jgi:hypothetical protein